MNFLFDALLNPQALAPAADAAIGAPTDREEATPFNNFWPEHPLPAETGLNFGGNLLPSGGNQLPRTRTLNLNEAQWDPVPVTDRVLPEIADENSTSFEQGVAVTARVPLRFSASPNFQPLPILPPSGAVLIDGEPPAIPAAPGGRTPGPASPHGQPAQGPDVPLATAGRPVTAGSAAAHSQSPAIQGLASQVREPNPGPDAPGNRVGRAEQSLVQLASASTGDAEPPEPVINVDRRILTPRPQSVRSASDRPVPRVSGASPPVEQIRERQPFSRVPVQVDAMRTQAVERNGDEAIESPTHKRLESIFSNRENVVKQINIDNTEKQHEVMTRSGNAPVVSAETRSLRQTRRPHPAVANAGPLPTREPGEFRSAERRGISETPVGVDLAGGDAKNLAKSPVEKPPVTAQAALPSNANLPQPDASRILEGKTARSEASTAGAEIMGQPGAARMSAESVTGSRAPAPVLDLPLDIDAPDEQWGRAVGDRLLLMVDRQIGRAQIRLNPAHLGPLRVEIDTSGRSATVEFTAVSPAVREALETALPRLREMFEQQGMALSDASVREERGQQGGTGPDRDTLGGAKSDASISEPAEAQASNQSSRTRDRNSVIDTYV